MCYPFGLSVSVSVSIYSFICLGVLFFPFNFRRWQNGFDATNLTKAISQQSRLTWQGLLLFSLCDVKYDQSVTKKRIKNELLPGFNLSSREKYSKISYFSIRHGVNHFDNLKSRENVTKKQKIHFSFAPFYSLHFTLSLSSIIFIFIFTFYFLFWCTVHALYINNRS